MVWGKAGSTTLSSAGDNITVSDMTASENNVIMLHKINSGSVNPLLTFNSDSGSNYAWRYSSNGGTDSTVTNGTKLEMAVTGITPTLFTIFYVINISAEEKLVIGNTVEQNTAGTAPQRMEVAGKWTNTSSQITALNFGNDAAGDYAIDSNASAIGSDLTPAAAVPALGANVQVGSRYEETDTRKMYSLTDPLIADDDFTSYADQTAFDNSWVTSNTAKFRGNPTNDNIDILNSNAYDNIYYDLGSVSDTKWLCKFKVTLTTAGSQALGICYFYVGSTTGDANESNDGLGFYFYDDANNTYALADNGNRPDQTSVTGALGINPSTTTYYAEMKRTSATGFTVTLYSDSSYSTSLGTATLTISSGITGLRYFKIMGYTTSGGLVGTLDDFKFYNNSTDTSKYWQEIGA